MKNLKYNMKKIIFKLTFLILLGFCSLSFSQRSDNSIVVVNGSKITSAQLDQWLSVAISEGKKDTPELRQAILNDLVVREAIAQDIKKTNLLSKGNNAFKVRVAEQNAAMDLWFSQYLAAHPVSEAEVDTLIFRLPTGEQISNMENIFRNLMVRSNMRRDGGGQNRTLYSLRHTYATFALARGVDIHTLARQMGTSVGMIERHYSKLTPMMNAEKLA